VLSHAPLIMQACVVVSSSGDVVVVAGIVCCSLALQCVTLFCYIVLHIMSTFSEPMPYCEVLRILPCDAVCCSVLQCIVVCCSVMQYW